MTTIKKLISEKARDYMDAITNIREKDAENILQNIRDIAILAKKIKSEEEEIPF